MRFPVRIAVRSTLTVLALASLAACASAPKPMGPAPTQQPPPPQQQQEAAPTPAPAPAPVTEQAPSGPIPGSMQDFVVNVGDRVYFEFDKYDVRDDARPLLDAQAAWLRRYPNVRVRIEGNCDELGTREYNFALGARRSQTVRDYLASKGVSASRIKTTSFGKERPVAVCDDISCWSQNRRGVTVLNGQ